jgi:hypothetical protein
LNVTFKSTIEKIQLCISEARESFSFVLWTGQRLTSWGDMSRPSSPYAPNGPSSGSNMHQLNSPIRPSTDSGHDLPYLRVDRQNSHDSSSGARPSTGGQQPTRPSGPPGRSSTQDYPSSQTRPEVLPRPSRSASGHTSPTGPDDFAAPTPAWLGSTSRPSSDENHRSLTQPPSTSGHSSSATAINSQLCFSCGLPMTGQFVRALGTVYHLDCFKCKVHGGDFNPATSARSQPFCSIRIVMKLLLPNSSL